MSTLDSQERGPMSLDLQAGRGKPSAEGCRRRGLRAAASPTIGSTSDHEARVGEVS
jgi:hypothetical protein